MSYWQDRYTNGLKKLSGKSEKQIQKQMSKYYANAAKSVIDEFEKTYNHLLLAVEEGRQPTPADLYKLEKYWEMTGNLRKTLNNLSEKEIEMLTRVFRESYSDIYNGLDLPGDVKFSTLAEDTVQQLITSVWCADGKTWSSRVWDNTGKLAEALNEELINTILTGKKTTDLKKRLQEQFNVNYSEANRLVRTELAHIQTKAAEQRYKDSGIEYVEVWADEDERRCKTCGKLHQKKYRVGETLPIPAHPNCRCCIIPVIENVENSKKIVYNNKKAIDNSTVSSPVDITNSTTKPSETKIAPEWENANFAPDKVEKHKKHLSEYGEITFDDYVKGARILLSKPVGGNIDGFENNAGATYRYDKENNDFAIGKNGIIFTRFKPINKQKYWEMIKNEELKQLQKDRNS